MERSYLDFEKPIEEINNQIAQTIEIGDKGKVDINSTLKELEIKLSITIKKIFEHFFWFCMCSSYWFFYYPIN